MKFFTEDNSENKEVSILRLKSEILRNEKFLNENSFTKKDLLLLCQTLKLKVNPQLKKDEVIAVVVKGILETQTDKIPVEMHAEQPGPSGINPTPVMMPTSDPAPSEPVSSVQTAPAKRKSKGASGKGKCKGKGKGKGKKSKRIEETSEETDDKCVICNLAYSDGEEWICCDVCLLWYHRDCAQLQDDCEWQRLSEEGEQFICPMCN